MKTKEELNAIKQECEALASKLRELTADELQEVTGGTFNDSFKKPGKGIKGMNPYDEQVVASYSKDVNSDKNAKVIFS